MVASGFPAAFGSSMTAEIADPIALFTAWMAEAETHEPNDPNAMALATADAEGRPSVRMVLLKGWDADGFIFYTNLESRKGGELAPSPRSAPKRPTPISPRAPAPARSAPGPRGSRAHWKAASSLSAGSASSP